MKKQDQRMWNTTAEEIESELMTMRNEADVPGLQRFFKTGKGEYAEGDKFLGLRNPQTRMVVKAAKLTVKPDQLLLLTSSPWHEVRLSGFLLMVEETLAALPKRSDSPDELKRKAQMRQSVAELYLSQAHMANNWDLVDLSCPTIIGEWLTYPSADGTMPSTHILDQLAEDPCLWRQRIAMVSTLGLIRHSRTEEALRLAAKLLGHPHHLMHKAVGWMLREVGKKDLEALRDFLSDHATQMPRTALRYAIERLDETERQMWLKKKFEL